MKATVNFDTVKVKKKLDRNISRAQFVLDSQALKDANYYAPEDTGDLQSSGIRGSKLGQGVLVWDEIYSKTQYYLYPNKSTDKNPNARWKWWEFAKAKFRKEWIKLANRALRGKA